MREDAQVVEQLQTNAPTFTSSALIGSLEERVVWYETAYRDIMESVSPADRFAIERVLALRPHDDADVVPPWPSSAA